MLKDFRDSFLTICPRWTEIYEKRRGRKIARPVYFPAWCSSLSLSLPTSLCSTSLTFSTCLCIGVFGQTVCRCPPDPDKTPELGQMSIPRMATWAASSNYDCKYWWGGARKAWEEEGKTKSLQSFPFDFWTVLISLLAFSLRIIDNFANCFSVTTRLFAQSFKKLKHGNGCDYYQSSNKTTLYWLPSSFIFQSIRGGRLVNKMLCIYWLSLHMVCQDSVVVQQQIFVWFHL